MIFQGDLGSNLDSGDMAAEADERSELPSCEPAPIKGTWVAKGNSRLAAMTYGMKHPCAEDIGPVH